MGGGGGGVLDEGTLPFSIPPYCGSFFDLTEKDE